MLIIDSLNCVKDDDGTYSVSAHYGNKSVYENTDIADGELNALFGNEFADVIRNQPLDKNTSYSSNEINQMRIEK